MDTIVVPTDAQALILENNLIKEHRPRFNIQLRDDKTYPYIKVTVQEPFPRVLVTRRVVNDGARYFGPYTDVGAMRRALNVVKRLFTVRSCHYDLPREAPPLVAKLQDNSVYDFGGYQALQRPPGGIEDRSIPAVQQRLLQAARQFYQVRIAE